MFCLGGFWKGGFLARGVLSRGFLSGGLCPGVFCPRTEYKLHALQNTKATAAKDHGKNDIKVRSPKVHHLLHNRLLSRSVYK